MRGDLIKTFKIINGISNHGRKFLNIFLEQLIYCQDITRAKSPKQLYFFAYWVIFFKTNCLVG